MLKPARKLALLALFILPICLAISGCNFSNKIESPRFSSEGSKPRIMLWAWEAPGDLRWINSQQIGVAFLAETLTLYDDKVWAKPRLQPLKVNSDTFLTAVIRIESSKSDKPTLDSAQMDRILATVIKVSKLPGVRDVQIDFDAKLSERDFYKRLLTRLRENIPADKTLSMTALASWCTGDRWLTGTSADEIVPMFFSMGADSKQVAHYLRAGKKVESFSKERAIGLADSSSEITELISENNRRELLDGRRLYLFSARTWTKDHMEQLLRKVGTI